MINSDVVPLLSDYEEQMPVEPPKISIPVAACSRNPRHFQAEIHPEEVYPVKSIEMWARSNVDVYCTIKDGIHVYHIVYFNASLRKRDEPIDKVKSGSWMSSIRNFFSLQSEDKASPEDFAILFTSPLPRRIYTVMPVSDQKDIVDRCEPGQLLKVLDKGFPDLWAHCGLSFDIERKKGDKRPESIIAQLYKKKGSRSKPDSRGSYFVPVVDKDSNYITRELKCRYKSKYLDFVHHRKNKIE